MQRLVAAPLSMSFDLPGIYGGFEVHYHSSSPRSIRCSRVLPPQYITAPRTSRQPLLGKRFLLPRIRTQARASRSRFTLQIAVLPGQRPCLCSSRAVHALSGASMLFRGRACSSLLFGKRDSTSHPGPRPRTPMGGRVKLGLARLRLRVIRGAIRAQPSCWRNSAILCAIDHNDLPILRCAPHQNCSFFASSLCARQCIRKSPSCPNAALVDCCIARIDCVHTSWTTYLDNASGTALALAYAGMTSLAIHPPV